MTSLTLLSWLGKVVAMSKELGPHRNKGLSLVSRIELTRMVDEAGVMFRYRSTHWLWRWIYKGMWMTVDPVIWVPDGVKDPLSHTDVILHELVHIDQQRWHKKGQAHWFASYLASPRFRWRMEREAYMVQLRRGHSLDSVLRALSGYALWGVSRSEMEAWFKKELGS